MYKVAESNLNASTLDILNVIRENASPEYQASIPQITDEKGLVKVGETLYGHSSLANEFLNALVNRIGLVRTKSMTFNNPYSRLKKGFMEFGDTIEEIFVDIVKAYEFSDEKEGAREFKKYLPIVKSAFHVINWHVFYPVTVENDQLRKAFLSMSGVQDLITYIVESVYRSAEYDEFLLFKYLLIKKITAGKLAPVSIGNGSDLKDAGKAFRGVSNGLLFPKKTYNERNVLNTTPRERQVIFMDAQFNADYDVDVLASAFNMDKATYQGALNLIDDWTTFDNDRWSVIRSECDNLEEVTSTELALMADVKAVLLDEDWFQVYDNLAQFTETFISSEIRWNYFYHTWKTISTSPFANAVVFVTSSATITSPSTLTFEVTDKSVDKKSIVLTLMPSSESASLRVNDYQFVQTSDCIADGIGVHPYGVYLIPIAKKSEDILATVSINGDTYIAGSAITGASVAVGDTITLSKQSFNDAFTVFSPRPDMEVYGSTVGAIQDNVEVVVSTTSGGNAYITGTLNFIEGGLAQSGPLAGDGNFLALKVRMNPSVTWSSVKVGLDPSEGTGLVELLGDPDMVVVAKIADNTTQVFKVVAKTSTNETITGTFDLSQLVCETE